MSSNEGIAMARRGARGSVPLSRRCCLRCSKHLRQDPNLVCNKRAHRSCRRCSRLHSPCYEIPGNFHAAANRVIAAADAVVLARNEERNDHALLTALGVAQRKYTRRVEAFIRANPLPNSSRTPRPQAQTAELMLVQMSRLVNATEGVLDVMRLNARLPDIVRDQEDEDDDDDDEEEELEEDEGGEELEWEEEELEGEEEEFTLNGLVPLIKRRSRYSGPR